MQQDNILRFNGTVHPNFDCKAALEDILWEYRDCENKIASHHSVINKVRDYYYFLETGMKYKEWIGSR